MAIIISHSHFVYAAFVSSLVCQTFDRMILGRMSFPGAKCFQGGTRWKGRANKWCAIRKSLWTADPSYISLVCVLSVSDGSLGFSLTFFHDCCHVWAAVVTLGLRSSRVDCSRHAWAAVATHELQSSCVGCKTSYEKFDPVIFFPALQDRCGPAVEQTGQFGRDWALLPCRARWWPRPAMEVRLPGAGGGKSHQNCREACDSWGGVTRTRSSDRPCPTQMSCWAKNHVTILTRAAHWMILTLS